MLVVLAQSLDTVNDKVTDVVNTGLASLPLIGIALVVGVGARVLSGLAHRGLQRSGARPIAVDLLSNLVRGGLYFVAALFARSVAGVPWPARTLVLDTPITIDRNGAGAT